MKRALFAAGAFWLTAVLTLLLCGWIGAKTPVLRQGEALPDDVSTRLYTIPPALLERTDRGARLVLAAGEGAQEPLSLTLCDGMAFTLFLDGTEAAAYGEDDPYSRVICIPLGTEAPAAKERIELLFEGEGWKQLDWENLSNVPKMLLGGTAATQRALNLAFGATMLLIGAFFVLIVSSLTLFFQKRTERYLLLLAGASCVILLTTLITSPVSLLPIRYGQYLAIRPYIVSFPVLVNGAVCVNLMKNALPERLRRFSRPVWLAGAALILALVQIATGKNIYHWLTAAMLVPVLGAIGCGAARKEPGVWLLAAGYGFWQGIALRIYVVNGAQMQLPGVIGVYFRLTQLGHLVYLLCCMALINGRYARKFGESEQLNALLDVKIEERTHQLLTEQEQRRMMMLNVFHDLRSPLFALQGHLEELEAQTGERAVFEDVRLRMGFLQRLIEDLFLLSKLEDGKVRFDGDYVELRQLLVSLAHSAKAQAQRAGLSLDVCAEEPLWVWGDGMRLQQILQNLVDNAIAHTPPGGTVSLSLRQEGDWAALSVADTGKGIASDEMERVFDRYYHSSRTGSQKSTGLGLAIVKSLTELHHGTVEVQSAEGRGACFTVRLPLLERGGKS